MEKSKKIYCGKCGKIFRKVFFEGNRYEIECDCGNIIKGDI